ncbi:hypothetical protein J2125_004457 [Erwinia toletana]|uniref:Uncharacterized protein n=1 Tax=Winslowiella toletana TaxID=92490 RepID=A0ABS4PGL6_9GAMM|nr:hypothetical protein [Winslowiella toletana]MBP2171265.1 hypothetical protein [Winslowiella toletana]
MTLVLVPTMALLHLMVAVGHRIAVITLQVLALLLGPWLVYRWALEGLLQVQSQVPHRHLCPAQVIARTAVIVAIIVVRLVAMLTAIVSMVSVIRDRKIIKGSILLPFIKNMFDIVRGTYE